jgi:cullin-associated NEDD8-dissociated protein 1
MTIAFIITF